MLRAEIRRGLYFAVCAGDTDFVRPDTPVIRPPFQFGALRRKKRQNLSIADALSEATIFPKFRKISVTIPFGPVHECEAFGSNVSQDGFFDISLIYHTHYSTSASDHSHSIRGELGNDFK